MCVVRVALSSDILETLETFVSFCMQTNADQDRNEQVRPPITINPTTNMIPNQQKVLLHIIIDITPLPHRKPPRLLRSKRHRHDPLLRLAFHSRRTPLEAFHRDHRHAVRGVYCQVGEVVLPRCAGDAVV